MYNVHRSDVLPYAYNVCQFESTQTIRIRIGSINPSQEGIPLRHYHLPKLVHLGSIHWRIIVHERYRLHIASKSINELNFRAILLLHHHAKTGVEFTPFSF